MWLSLKVIGLLIVSLQPAGRRMRPSFGTCYVARSGAKMLEELNLGGKQAQCYTPSQDSPCYKTAGEPMLSVGSPHALQHHCKGLVARVRSITKSLGIKLPLNAVWGQEK